MPHLSPVTKTLVLIVLAVAGEPYGLAQQAPALSGDTADTLNCAAQADAVKEAYIAKLSKSDRAMLRVKDIPILQPTNSVKLRVEKVWHSALDECERKKRSASASANSSPSEGTIPVAELAGRLFVTIDGKEGRKAMPLSPVSTEGGQPSDSLFKCETDEHKMLFFYRDRNARFVSEVVPIEDKDSKNGFLEKNGKFMLALDRNGGVTYVNMIKPTSPPPTATDQDKPMLLPRPSQSTSTTPPPA